MSYQSAVPARGPEVVLRLVPTVISGMVLGAALLTAYFQIPAHDPGLRIIALGGGLGALTVAVLTIRFRFRIRSGRLTATILWRRPQSVDLTRLTSAEAMAEQDAPLVATALGQQRWLELRDETGSVVRLTFYGTTRGQRKRMLAALEPYVMAEGVSRTGLVTEALAGELWWPWPGRRRS
jgi:hypothetical protein